MDRHNRMFAQRTSRENDISFEREKCRLEKYWKFAAFGLNVVMVGMPFVVSSGIVVISSQTVDQFYILPEQRVGLTSLHSHPTSYLVILSFWVLIQLSQNIFSKNRLRSRFLKIKVVTLKRQVQKAVPFKWRAQPLLPID